jgi:hypothetical protein
MPSFFGLPKCSPKCPLDHTSSVPLFGEITHGARVRDTSAFRRIGNTDGCKRRSIVIGTVIGYPCAMVTKHVNGR